MFVIGFERIATRSVFDTHSFGSMLQIADDLVLEATVDFTGGGGDPMPQKAHHVQALEVAHGVVDKSRIVLL